MLPCAVNRNVRLIQRADQVVFLLRIIDPCWKMRAADQGALLAHNHRAIEGDRAGSSAVPHSVGGAELSSGAPVENQGAPADTDDGSDDEQRCCFSEAARCAQEILINPGHCRGDGSADLRRRRGRRCCWRPCCWSASAETGKFLRCRSTSPFVSSSSRLDCLSSVE